MSETTEEIKTERGAGVLSISSLASLIFLHVVVLHGL